MSSSPCSSSERWRTKPTSRPTGLICGPSCPESFGSVKNGRSRRWPGTPASILSARCFVVGGLDELPQLYNVLNGTMSLVGPRPSVHYELEDYKDWHRDRLSVKPGITGLWQVHGRGRTGFDDMVRMDLRYIGDWSILEDIKLLALTIPAALGRNGAQ